MTPLKSCNVLITKRLKFSADGGVSIDLSSSGCRKALPSAVLGAVALYE